MEDRGRGDGHAIVQAGQAPAPLEDHAAVLHHGQSQAGRVRGNPLRHQPVQRFPRVGEGTLHVSGLLFQQLSRLGAAADFRRVPRRQSRTHFGLGASAVGEQEGYPIHRSIHRGGHQVFIEGGLVQESTAKGPARRSAADLEQQAIGPFLQAYPDQVVVFAHRSRTSAFMHQLAVEPDLHRAVSAQAHQHRQRPRREDLRRGVADTGLFHPEHGGQIYGVPLGLNRAPAKRPVPASNGGIRLRTNPCLALDASEVVRLHDLSLGSRSGDVGPSWVRSQRTQDQPSSDEVVSFGPQGKASHQGRALLGSDGLVFGDGGGEHDSASASQQATYCRQKG